MLHVRGSNTRHHHAGDILDLQPVFIGELSESAVGGGHGIVRSDELRLYELSDSALFLKGDYLRGASAHVNSNYNAHCAPSSLR